MDFGQEMMLTIYGPSVSWLTPFVALPAAELFATHLGRALRIRPQRLQYPFTALMSREPKPEVSNSREPDAKGLGLDRILCSLLVCCM